MGGKNGNPYTLLLPLKGKIGGWLPPGILQGMRNTGGERYIIAF
jgi:hypothetical protein